jgi:hypothetical protein
MKKTLMVAGMVAGAVGAYAQGSLNWGDAQTGMTIEILSPSTSTPTVEQTGQTSYDDPSGSTAYSGGYIGGATSGNGPGIGATPANGYDSINYQNAGNFEAGLYIATSQSALTSAITSGTPAATTTLLGGGNDGLYNTAPGAYTSGLAVGTPVWIGIAAWYSGGGAGTYAAAYQASLTGGAVQGYVESDTTVALGGGSGAPAGLSGLGLTSFSLAGATPEPSTIALGVIGASAFLMRLRRKQ